MKVCLNIKQDYFPKLVKAEVFWVIVYGKVQASLVPVQGISGAVESSPADLSELWIDGFHFHHGRVHNGGT